MRVVRAMWRLKQRKPLIVHGGRLVDNPHIPSLWLFIGRRSVVRRLVREAVPGLARTVHLFPSELFFVVCTMKKAVQFD